MAPYWSCQQIDTEVDREIDTEMYVDTKRDIELATPLVRTDKIFVSFSSCNPTAFSHWLTQSQKEADIYYLFIIG